MSVMEKILKLSKNGCDDALLNYICDNYDETECELSMRNPKSIIIIFVFPATKKKLDSQKSILICTKCGLGG